MRAWIGKEKEGRFKGKKTLFITTKVSFDEINDIINKHKNIKQLYFGAGNRTPPNWEVIKKCVLKYHNVNEYKKYKIIIVELDLRNIVRVPKELINRIHFMFTINGTNATELKKFNKTMTMIKIQDINECSKYLTVFDLDKGIETDMDKHIDKTYKGDVIVLK